MYQVKQNIPFVILSTGTLLKWKLKINKINTYIILNFTSAQEDYKFVKINIPKLKNFEHKFSSIAQFECF